MNPIVSFETFSSIEIRTGTITEVEDFPEARVPAFIVRVDFGAEIGCLRTSARITGLYERDELVGRQVLGVVNIPPRQIGPVRSEFLLVGLYRSNGDVVLAVPDKEIENGAKLG